MFALIDKHLLWHYKMSPGKITLLNKNIVKKDILKY